MQLNLHMSEKRKYLEYFGRRLLHIPPKLRSHICANTNDFPLKIQIYLIFTAKSLYIPNICSNFVPDFVRLCKITTK